MKLVKNACKCHRNSAVQKLVYDTLIKSKTDFDSNKFKDCFEIVLTAIADAKLVYSGVENDRDFCVFCHRQIANSENKENVPVAKKKKRRNYSIYSVKVDEQDETQSRRKSVELKLPPKGEQKTRIDDVPKSKPKPKSKQQQKSVADEAKKDFDTFWVHRDDEDDDLFWDYEDISEKHEKYNDDDNVYYDYMCTSEDDIEEDDDDEEYEEDEEDLVMPESLPIKSDAVQPFMKLDTMVRDCKEEIVNAWVFLNKLKKRL